MKSTTKARAMTAIAITAILPATFGCGGSAANSKTTAKTMVKAAQSQPLNPAISVSQKVSPSIVAIITRGSQQGEGRHGQTQTEGSGIFFRQDGYIITNAHVITDPNNTFVDFIDGTEVKAKVVGTDTFSDIGIIKIDKTNLPVPQYGQSSGVKRGQTAIAIGNPFGFENTVTEGVVSATRRSIPGGAPSLTNMIQTDAAISPGNSGGALVNQDGQIIGVTTAFIPPQTGAVSLGFAIPVDVAKRVGNQLIDTGKATHAFLGLSPDTLAPDTANSLNVPVNQGAVVLDVVGGGPADKAGIKKNDVIIEMDGLPVRTADDVFGVVNAHAPGDKVGVDYYRGLDKNTTTVMLGERSGGENKSGIR